MNLHPILVHFPIGVLSLYVAMELFRFKKLLALPGWDHTKAYAAIAGTALGGIAFLFGDSSFGATTDPIALKAFNFHQNFALATLLIFTPIALHYLMDLMGRQRLFYLPGWLITVLAILGFVCLLITGGLGGSLVYGPDVDPLVQMIYKYFIY